MAQQNYNKDLVYHVGCVLDILFLSNVCKNNSDAYIVQPIKI